MSTSSILIVEDERIIARGIEKQLTTMGYIVAGSAATGEEAIRKAVQLRPDLILMDINLGKGMDGVEAASLIRQQVDVPVVYLTANSDDATLHRAKLTDLFGYVLKPYDYKELRTAIEIGLYRHKTEWRLRANEQWLAATLSSIGDGVIATDDQCRVQLMNALAERLTGWRQAEALGKHVQEIFHIVEEKSRQPVPNPILNALATGQQTELPPNTILIDRTWGERPIEDSASQIRTEGGKVFGAVLVFRDISERRRLESHLRQAQKMEAIGQMAGGIAHDFNNIMTVITGYSDLLLTDGIQSAPLPAGIRSDALQNIYDAGLRAAALTHQIMAFSRKQMLVPSVLNLNTIVRDMVVMVKRLIESNIDLVTELAADLGQVKADPTQIGQVILNLAVNARDAMRHGGRLVIATSNADLGPETTRLHPDVKPGRYAVLSISDTGCGMSHAVVPHIFEPFFTTKGVGQGTGLGLATVFGIIKQSGGHIEVTSAVDVGTTFRVYLPLVVTALPQPTTKEIRLAARGHETILVVEDEESILRMTRLILQKSGYTVLEASNGLEGVAVAKEHNGPIHLLLTDMMMPNLSGRQLAEQLIPLKRGMRVLFMSGYTEEVMVEQGYEVTAVNFLHKPFSIAGMTNKVREIMDLP